MTKQQRQAAMRGQESQNQSGTAGILVALGVTAVIGATAYCIRDIQKHPEGKLATLYGNSFLKQIVNDLFSKVDSVFEPANDKLLPDWGNPTVYGAIPPGTPAPPLLVIDVEKTLIGSVHDASHGWRHVKRPGLDKFINALSQYYEIVLFSENDVGVAQDILMHIDPEGKCHKLGSAAAELRGTLVLKRLDLMNRDEARIILVDDSPESSQLFPRNTLLIKPFTNINDKTDRALLDLIPLLQAMVHDGVSDFRATIEDLGTHDAEQAVVEYKMRVSARKNAEDRKRNIGLGGLVRGPRNTEDGEDARSSIILTPAQIVGGIDPSVSNKSILGHKPVPKKDEEALQGQGPRKQGGLFAWVDKQSRDNSERNQLRMEKMNELYNKREMDKRAKEAEAAAPKKRSQDEEDEEW